MEQKPGVICENNISILGLYQKTKLGNWIVVSFFDGAKVEIRGETPADYRVRFYDGDNGICVYESTIKPGHWAQPNYRFFVNWLIRVEENGQPAYEHRLDFTDRRVLICLDGGALGDTISWFPYAQEFKNKHPQCEVHVSSFWNKLFDPMAYPHLSLCHPGQDMMKDFYAVYKVGAFDNDYNRNRNNWRVVPLQQIASDCLGLRPKEVRPIIKPSKALRPVADPYVAIAEFSTLYGKQWNHPEGWQTVVDYLNASGLKVVSVSKEVTGLKNVIPMNERPIEETICNIQHAEFFIGLSSGLSWLAWGLDKPVVMISGVTHPRNEMKDCIRIHNPNVCNGCLNDKELVFDRGNWRYCPRNGNFECTTRITPQMVIQAIEPLVKKIQRGPRPRFSLMLPTKDRPHFIRRAVDSILDQDFGDFELLIKDGGESIKHLLPDDIRIKYEKTQDTDLVSDLNRAMFEARGDILNFPSDDDVMLPGTLRLVHEHMADHKWLYGCIQRSDGGIQGQAWDPTIHAHTNIVPCPAAFWTREARDTVGAWDSNLVCADYDYWHRLASRWLPKYIPKILVDYQVHPGQDTWARQAGLRRDHAKVMNRYSTGFYKRRKVLFIAPHLSTGGMPQYLLWLVKDLVSKNIEVAVAEWMYAGDAYCVQRDQIKALCPIYKVEDPKWNSLREIIYKFDPDTIHLQEFPEMFMDEQSINTVYQHGTADYTIIETAHSTRFTAKEKKTKPNLFEFVGDWHVCEFMHFGVPWVLNRYQLPKRKRPDRAEALKLLGEDPGDRHVLQVGLWASWKDQATTVKLARMLPEVRFHFVGNLGDNFRHYWEPLMNDLPENVRVWGERNDVDKFYSAMDLFFFPSTEECSPLSVKEALSWGMPVMMRELPACADEFRGKVGFIPDDLGDIAASVGYALDPQNELTAIGSVS